MVTVCFRGPFFVVDRPSAGHDDDMSINASRLIDHLPRGSAYSLSSTSTYARLTTGTDGPSAINYDL